MSTNNQARADVMRAIQDRTDRVEELVHLAQHRMPLTPSEQSRADAFADAETLRRFALLDLEPCSWRRKAITRSGYGLVIDTPEWPSWAAREATLKARAAFRAVPGLRG